MRFLYRSELTMESEGIGLKSLHEAIDTASSTGKGYQYNSNFIVRKDNDFIHSEVVKPALRLLNQKHYAGVISAPTVRGTNAHCGRT